MCADHDNVDRVTALDCGSRFDEGWLQPVGRAKRQAAYPMEGAGKRPDDRSGRRAADPLQDKNRDGQN